jgi:dihydropteroate synthase
MIAWQVRDRAVKIGPRTLVMGIVNVTPDSFSDGGNFFDAEAAFLHALKLQEQGADILDIGGESTRPGSLPVSAEEELRRVLPVVERLAKQTKVLLSVDTSKAIVARACLEAGAHIINDVTALTGDADLPEVVRNLGAGVILMHMQGTPATMQVAPFYQDVVKEILHFFEDRIQAVTEKGIPRSCLMIDPGLGFGKTFEHNLEILARLGEFRQLGLPICLGPSRKGFIGKMVDRPVGERLAGSLAVAAFALAQKAAQVLRVHDMEETQDLVRVWHTLQEEQDKGKT